MFLVGGPRKKIEQELIFSSDDWVKKQIDAGKLSLQFLPLSGPTLSANTEELRKLLRNMRRIKRRFRKFLPWFGMRNSPYF